VLDDGTTQLYQFDYNPYGKIKKIVDAASPARTTTFQYDPNNIDLLYIYQERSGGSSTDEYGQAADKVAAYTYNTQHLPLTATDAAGQTTQFTYNGNGQPLTVTNAKGELTQYGYGSASDPDGVGAGYLKTITRHLYGTGGSDTPSVTGFRYDGFGRLYKVIDPVNYTLIFNYDAIGGTASKTLNRLAKITYPDNSTEQMTYNLLDVEWTQDRLGRWTHNYHDALRHLEAVQDPNYNFTQYQWCNCGSLEAIIDQKGNQTSFIRDAQSRVKSKIFPDRTSINYQYENNTSRIHLVTDAKNQTATYTYNPDDTLQSVVYSGSVTPSVSYTYDTVYPRVQTMAENGTTTTTYNYNPITAAATLGAGMLGSVVGPLATIGYGYDELGRATSRTIGTGNSSSIAFDSLGRVQTIANPLGTFNYGYADTTGRIDHVDYPNSQTVKYDYYGNQAPSGNGNGDERLSDIKKVPTSSPTSILAEYDYGYDKAGRITSWTQNWQGMSAAQSYTLGYDGVDQLMSGPLKNVSSGAVIHDNNFHYDAAGNRDSEQIDGVVNGATFNNLNQMTSRSTGGWMKFSGTVSKPSTITVGGRAANVDASGNWQVQAKVTGGANSIPVAATDASGHVTNKTISVTVNGVASSSPAYDLNGNMTFDGTRNYEWDALNRLIKVWAGAVNASSRTEMSYDGLSRRTKIVEKDASGNVTATRQFVWDGLSPAEERDGSNTVTKRFYGEGEQLAGTSYYFLQDHLGSVREMTDSSGTIRARYDYDLWGRQTKLGGDKDADFGFAGMMVHPISGLNLTLYRAYSTDLGRWISRDPIGEYGGINLYAYVGNQSVAYNDELGLSPSEYPGGHHYVIGPIRNDPTLSVDVQNLWMNETLKNILTPHLYDGPHRIYNETTISMYNGWLDAIGKTPSQLTVSDANDFLNIIKSTNHPDVRDFLKRIESPVTKVNSIIPFWNVILGIFEYHHCDTQMQNQPEIPYFIDNSNEIIINPYYRGPDSGPL